MTALSNKINHSHLIKVNIIALIFALCFTFAFSSYANSEPTGSRSIKLKITTPEHCYYGDYELIQKDIYAGDERNVKNIIVSIEQLGQKKLPAQTLLVSSISKASDPFSTQLEHSVTIPSVSESTLAGIFICKDSEKRGHCAQLPLLSFDQMAKGLLPGSAEFDPVSKKILPDAKARIAQRATNAADHIYYFQPLIIKPNGIEIIQAAALSNLEANLKAKGIYDEVAVLYTKKAIETIGSYPLRIKNGVLHLDIPRYSEASCPPRS